MTKKVKVISLGIGQANFLSQLYKGIREINKNISIDINSLRKLSKDVDYQEMQVFDNFLDLKNIKYPTNLRFCVETLLKKRFLHELIINFYYGKVKFRWHSVKAFIKQYLHNYYVGYKYLGKADYDIYHFHFIKSDRIQYLYFLPQDKKIVCSFWGSDLMRTSGSYEYHYQLRAIQRANIITTHSPETREILLSKYGRKFKPKIRYTQFTLDITIFDLIDHYLQASDEVYNFKQKLGALPESFVITIGHNASHFNNHIEIINQLEVLHEDLKKRIVCVLPLTYGDITKGKYVEEVKDYCSNSSITCICITEYLSNKDLALLRTSTDMMIHMPESDALSGTATEAIYAGTILLAGAWLPYGYFRRKGIYFLEAEEFSDIPTIVSHVMQHEEKYRRKTIISRKVIRNNFFTQSTSPVWLEIYEELDSI